MKSEDTLYHEAVTRNLISAERKIKDGKKDYSGLDLYAAKHKLGIKKLDSTYDIAVKALIALAKIKKNHEEKESK